MTSYTLRKANAAKTRTDLVVIGVLTDGDGPKARLEAAAGGEDVASAYGRKLTPLLRAMGFGGTPGEALRVPSNGVVTASQVLFVGLGARDALTPEQVRRAAGVAARNLGNAASVALALPAADEDQLRAVVEGFASGSYRYAGHRSAPAPQGPAEVAVLSDIARRTSAQETLARARVLDEVLSVSRDWVNEAPNLLTPESFADAAVALAKERKAKVTTRVYEPAELEELGCGGILAVGMGSAHQPRLVTVSWAPKGATRHVALVGKGITYDSGGLSIKTAQGMTTMKCDMAGAAAVVAAVHAIASLELPVAVTGWAPMAENMVSGSSYRPGDVVRMRNGKTVEVKNTDAEGRMVLADALCLAAEEEPDVILDIATLTGPCVVALGERVAGLFGDDETVAAVEAAAEVTGELLWHLPIPEHIAESVRDPASIADVLQHNFVRWGSASYAAAFLREFTAGLPWAHLDTAGPAYNSGAPWGHVPAGATGYGTATLVEYVARLADEG